MKMTDADWQVALEVSRACLAARGAKGRMTGCFSKR